MIRFATYEMTVLHDGLPLLVSHRWSRSTIAGKGSRAYALAFCRASCAPTALWRAWTCTARRADGHWWRTDDRWVQL